MRFAAPLATLALLGAPAAALGQANPFNPLPQGQTVPTEVVVAPPSNNSDSGGLATWQQVLIFGAGLVLLLGIGWAIASDARRRAPVKDSELAHPGLGGPVKRNRSVQQKQRDRAKAKRGRQQRKANRRGRPHRSCACWPSPTSRRRGQRWGSRSRTTASLS